MAKSFPSFSFYPNDWLGSQAVARMTPAQEGAYIRLLCYCWNDPDCSLPDDDDTLATLSRLGNEGWLEGGSTVVKVCFNQHPTKKGFLTNNKLYNVWLERKEWSDKSRAGGLKSGEVRKEQADKDKATVVQPPLNPPSPLSVSVVRNPSPTPMPDKRINVAQFANSSVEGLIQEALRKLAGKPPEIRRAVQQAIERGENQVKIQEAIFSATAGTTFWTVPILAGVDGGGGGRKAKKPGMLTAEDILSRHKEATV